MNYTLVFHILGLILRVEAVLMLPAAVIGIATRGGDGSAFLLAAGITLAVGQALVMLPAKNAKMQARDGFAAVALSWIFLSLFGALPYVFSGVLPNYADAVFETVSGFTTTGASVLTFIEGQPLGVLFWRAQTQWMGGVGVLVLALALVPRLGEGSVYLMRAESPGPIKSKLTPKVGDDPIQHLYRPHRGGGPLPAPGRDALVRRGHPRFHHHLHRRLLREERQHRRL